MERKYNLWHDGLIRNSFICFTVALAAICPLAYQSYCYQFNVNLNSILSTLFGVLGGSTLFCAGPGSLIAWVVGAAQGKPERTLDALRSVIIGCLIGFYFTATYVLRK